MYIYICSRNVQANLYIHPNTEKNLLLCGSLINVNRQC